MYTVLHVGNNTFMPFSRRFYPMWLTISTIVRRTRNNNISLLVQYGCGPVRSERKSCPEVHYSPTLHQRTTTFDLDCNSWGGGLRGFEQGFHDTRGSRVRALTPSTRSRAPGGSGNGFERSGEAVGCSGIAGEPCDLRSVSSTAPFLTLLSTVEPRHTLSLVHKVDAEHNQLAFGHFFLYYGSVISDVLLHVRCVHPFRRTNEFFYE